ncbi:MAG: prepilin-type N-terminal cleavage/methylation domain-containing protein [Candidatus Margulisbacteria bacterium]|nr:prepilin-type N-terminal cleavage/methylation domain-containing protein [Candidatus Margulisiibacteriota bacterium]MBU1021726.1 prepilin-type N-terminal cleavage/methylation domain-containing protein [Candidatus Margulisiibacteriota bacterium]MBU1729472.1 prepilin-type N-terminal cleavage/methylation domain-containing protein [Candidatus Margulisiibacteriota bacterium]MBU1955427.1 prepilin-type N-terminal cleavage/methylation domain-containing protein [Candidatus Margulisiibacteriota bacteriu
MNKKGFTLIEILVSLTLFSLILSSTFLILKTPSMFWNRFVNKMAAFEVVSSVSGVIMRDIWEAINISVEEGGLRLILIDSGYSQIQYELVGGKIRRKKGGSSSYLTYDEQVDLLEFEDLGDGLVGFKLGVSTAEVFSFLMRSRNL